MPQKRLDDVYGRSFGGQLSCEGMPEGMCVDAALDPRFPCETWQHAADVRALKGISPKGAEDG
jgi:hypothetical protein